MHSVARATPSIGTIAERSKLRRGSQEEVNGGHPSKKVRNTGKTTARRQNTACDVCRAQKKGCDLSLFMAAADIGLSEIPPVACASCRRRGISCTTREVFAIRYPAGKADSPLSNYDLLQQLSEEEDDEPAPSSQYANQPSSQAFRSNLSNPVEQFDHEPWMVKTLNQYLMVFEQIWFEEWMGKNCAPRSCLLSDELADILDLPPSPFQTKQGHAHGSIERTQMLNAFLEAKAKWQSWVPASHSVAHPSHAFLLASVLDAAFSHLFGISEASHSVRRASHLPLSSFLTHFPCI